MSMAKQPDANAKKELIGELYKAGDAKAPPPDAAAPEPAAPTPEAETATQSADRLLADAKVTAAEVLASAAVAKDLRKVESDKEVVAERRMNFKTVLLPLILTLSGAVIAGIPGWIGLYRTRDVGVQVEELRHGVNSMKDELVREVKKTSFAEGKKAGRDEEP